MPSFLHSPVSVAHLLAVLVALATGTAVLFKSKGTLYHRCLGWAYVGSMSISLLTAFQIYFLFGRFGVVHWGAVASVAALLLGTGAAVFRSVVANWLRWHYFGMGASVTGLYAALVAESTYRFFPTTYFWWSTLGPASIIFVAGSLLLHRHYPTWAA
ncbi:MAG: hypothetical protein ACRYFV_14740 [Janthinobacterium lividum]|jgi:uncharacterized membrane protein